MYIRAIRGGQKDHCHAVCSILWIYGILSLLKGIGDVPTHEDQAQTPAPAKRYNLCTETTNYGVLFITPHTEL